MVCTVLLAVKPLPCITISVPETPREGESAVIMGVLALTTTVVGTVEIGVGYRANLRKSKSSVARIDGEKEAPYTIPGEISAPSTKIRWMRLI